MFLNKGQYVISIDDIRQERLIIKNKLLELSHLKSKILRNGYKDDSNLDIKIDKLLTYDNVLNYVFFQLFYSYNNDTCEIDYDCINFKSLQSLIEKIHHLTGINCKISYLDYHINDSKLEDWILRNPRCISYESWNKWAKLKSKELRIELSSEITFQKLMLELSLKTITNEILVVSKVYSDVNELDIKLARKEEDQLLLELNLLLEKVPTADIDLSLYRKLYDNNISFDLVREIYENNLELKVEENRTDSKVMLKTSMHTYPLEDIKTNLPIEELSLELRQKYINLISNYKNG